MKHLTGWSTGNMDGGRWVLQSWSDLDPSLYVPKPSDGKNFLFVNRFDIHSGEHRRLYRLEIISSMAKTVHSLCDFFPRWMIKKTVYLNNRMDQMLCFIIKSVV